MKTAIISGASSGIGKAIAEAFSTTGMNLVLISKSNKTGLAETGSACEKNGSRVLLLSGDAASEAFCREAAESAHRTFGPADILVNCAGISYVGLFQDMEPEEWQRLMAVNVGSVFLLCRQFIPDMVRAKSGRIINISSVWGNTGASCEAVYSASKGAVNAFTKALAKELAPSHICVNAIACGAIDTPMNGWLSDEEKEQLCEEIPAGRFGSPQEIADIALYLASAPEYLTGQIITADGGWT